MQESYREGIASRPGPSHARAVVRLHLKRWTGVSVGWVLSSEIGNPGCPWCQTVRRPHGSAQKTRVRGRSCGVEDPTPAEKPGALWARENRETPLPPASSTAGRREKVMNYKSLMHGSGESYCGVVLAKQPNKSERSPAEVVEGRPQAKENTPEPNPYRAPCRICGSHGLARVREAASVHFDAKRPYPRQEPCALVAPARVCAGGSGQPLSLPRPRVPLDPLGERSAPLEFLHARDLLRRGAREIDMMLNIARLRSRQF